MRALGAEVRSVTSGYGDAEGRRQRGDARLGDERRDDALRARLGDGPASVPDHRPRSPAAHRRRGRGAAPGARGPAAGPRHRVRRWRVERDRAARPLHRRAAVRLAVAEAAGDGIETGKHAAAILGGSPGILHGSRSLMLQDGDGQVVEAHSASAGLDYPGIGPQLAALAEAGRLEVAAATDREAVAAMKATTRRRGSCPRSRRPTRSPRCPRSSPGSRVCPVASRPTRELLVLLGFSGSGRQGPRGPHEVRRRRAVGERPMTIDELRAFCLGLPGTHREGDLGRRRARRRRHVPGQGQDLPDHGAGRRVGQHPDRQGAADRSHRRLP